MTVEFYKNVYQCLSPKKLLKTVLIFVVFIEEKRFNLKIFRNLMTKTVNSIINFLKFLKDTIDVSKRLIKTLLKLLT